MRTSKITYTVETVASLTDAGEAYLLRLFHELHSDQPPLEAPEAFITAAYKLSPDAPDDVIIRTMIGEAIGSTLKFALPKAYPAELGVTARVPRVAYEDTPEKLDPPEGATPVVIDKRQA